MLALCTNAENSTIYFPLRSYHLLEHSILPQTVFKCLAVLYKKHSSTLSNTEQQLGVIQGFQQSSWQIWRNWREKKWKKTLAVCDQHGRENWEVFSVVGNIELLRLRKSDSSEGVTCQSLVMSKTKSLGNTTKCLEQLLFADLCAAREAATLLAPRLGKRKA